MSEIATIVIGSFESEASSVNWSRWCFDVAKRGMDLILGTLALILLLPVMLICALIIKLSSDGPVLYQQIRVGKDGRLFNMYKLRTMYADAEQTTGPVWATSDDPRVMPACRWMRRGLFDELPQLVNVLKGEMSLVGPRPERPEILTKLEAIYPNIHKRHAVRPGITGLSQIRNGYDTTIESVRRKYAADIEYIATRGWGLELWILAATLPKFYDRSAH